MRAAPGGGPRAAEVLLFVGTGSVSTQDACGPRGDANEADLTEGI